MRAQVRLRLLMTHVALLAVPLALLAWSYREERLHGPSHVAEGLSVYAFLACTGYVVFRAIGPIVRFVRETPE